MHGGDSLFGRMTNATHVYRDSGVDADLEHKAYKVTEKLSESINTVANEPSVAFYRIQEHVRKTLPQLVEQKHEVEEVQQQVQGACFDTEYAGNAVKAMQKSVVHFQNIQDLLKNAMFMKQQIEYEEARKVELGEELLQGTEEGAMSADGERTQAREGMTRQEDTQQHSAAAETSQAEGGVNVIQQTQRDSGTDGDRKNGDDVGKDGVNVEIDGTDVKRDSMNAENDIDTQKDGTDAARDGIDVEKVGMDVNKDGTDVKDDTDVNKDDGDVEKDGMDVNKDGTDVEKDGTDLNKDGTDVEKDGTDLNKDGTDVEKDGGDIEKAGTDVKNDVESSEIEDVQRREEASATGVETGNEHSSSGKSDAQEQQNLQETQQKEGGDDCEKDEDKIDEKHGRDEES